MRGEYFETLAELAHEAMLLVDQPKYAPVGLANSLAHPGFTGDTYDFEGNGTLVIGMNRGGSDASAIDPIEQSALLELKSRPSASAYRKLSARSFELLPTWNIWARNLSLLFARVGVPLSSTAYIHAVPFRVRDNGQLRSIYPSVWHDFTVKQMKILNPGRVLFAGKGAGEALKRLVETKSRIVPRTIGDTEAPNVSGSPNARAIAVAHDLIASDREFWSSDV